MPAIDLLRKMRDSGYGEGSSEPQKSERYFELNEEESQGLQEGQEVTVALTGTFKDGCVYPREVKLAPPMGADAMPMKEVPSGPITVRNSVQPMPG